MFFCLLCGSRSTGLDSASKHSCREDLTAGHRTVVERSRYEVFKQQYPHAAPYDGPSKSGAHVPRQSRRRRASSPKPETTRKTVDRTIALLKSLDSRQALREARRIKKEVRRAFQ
jgi:hypothetical protein